MVGKFGVNAKLSLYIIQKYFKIKLYAYLLENFRWPHENSEPLYKISKIFKLKGTVK